MHVKCEVNVKMMYMHVGKDKSPSDSLLLKNTALASLDRLSCAPKSKRKLSQKQKLQEDPLRQPR